MYDVIGILPDTATHRHRRLIRSDSGNEYTVSQRISTGAWECSCRGWTTHRKCKHLPVEEVRAHWMCNGCQGIHCPQLMHADPRLRNTSIGMCCWCGGKRTTLSAPTGVELPCQDVHLEDVM